jgi:hypothetical protein
MARTWLSIRVDLVEGGGSGPLWPRPGRVFAASRTHTFADLATAVDDAFARWDRAHLHLFERSERRLLISPEWDDLPEGSRPSTGVRLSSLELGEQFVYTFDLGDDWTHLCTVAPARIDPVEVLGILPARPLPYWGWGAIPDQYGRDFDGDDGETELGPDPGWSDLPPLRPHWGPQTQHGR